ncbi:MAG: tetratricopeptide repeat protein [Nitrospirota bacterium]
MKKISSYSFILISLLFLFNISSCTYVSEKPEEIQLPESKKAISPADDEQKAFESFEEILNLTQTSDIQSVLPQIEALYLRIITEYPDIALAQECYWRLISLYVDKSVPPEYEKAETLYTEFLKRYPGSVLKSVIEDTLSKSYYKNGKWDKLLKLYTPAVNEFNEKGKLLNPDPMFMYAEARFNLGDLVEAEKAYKVVIELFPKSSRSDTSKTRLEEIEKRK